MAELNLAQMLEMAGFRLVDKVAFVGAGGAEQTPVRQFRQPVNVVRVQRHLETEPLPAQLLRRRIRGRVGRRRGFGLRRANPDLRPAIHVGHRQAGVHFGTRRLVGTRLARRPRRSLVRLVHRDRSALVQPIVHTFPAGVDDPAGTADASVGTLANAHIAAQRPGLDQGLGLARLPIVGHQVPGDLAAGDVDEAVVGCAE